MTDHKKEFAILEDEKKKLYNGLKDLREEMMTLQMARHSAEVILNGSRKASQNRENRLSI